MEVQAPQMSCKPCARAVWEPLVASGRDQGCDCLHLTLKTGLGEMPNRRFWAIVVPAALSFIVTVAVMKKPATVTNKPSTRV